MKDRNEAFYHCITNIYMPILTTFSLSSSSSSSSSLSSSSSSSFPTTSQLSTNSRSNNHDIDFKFYLKNSFIYKLAMTTINHDNCNSSSNSNSSSSSSSSPSSVLFGNTIRALFITLIQYYPSIYIKSTATTNTFCSNRNDIHNRDISINHTLNWLQQYIILLQQSQQQSQSQSQQQSQHSIIMKLHTCKLINELLIHDLYIYKRNQIKNTFDNYIFTTTSTSTTNNDVNNINDSMYDHDLTKIPLICASNSLKYTISVLINMLHDVDHLIRAQAAVAIGNLSKIIWKLLEMYPINCLLPHINPVNIATIPGYLSMKSTNFISIRLYIIYYLLFNMKDKVGSVRSSSYKSMGDCIINNILIIITLHNHHQHDYHHKNIDTKYSNKGSCNDDDENDKRNSHIISDKSSERASNHDDYNNDYQLINTILSQLLSGCHDSNLTVRIQAVWSIGTVYIYSVVVPYCLSYLFIIYRK